MDFEIIDVTGVEVLGGRTLRFTFNDGSVRDIDTPLPMRPASAELSTDGDLFAQVRVDPDARTIVWPSDADVSAHTPYTRSRLVRQAS